MKRWTIVIASFAALVAVWECLVRVGFWSPLLVPSPLEIGRFWIGGLRDHTLLTASWVTLKRLVVGYALGVVIGLPLGFLNAKVRFIRDTFGLLALGMQTLPSICWAPLALLWFGQTEVAMLFIVIMGSVWSIALAMSAGIDHVPPLYLRAAQTMGSKGLHTWRHVILPASLPLLVSGMKQGWAFAWRSLMAAEVYITILTGFGLGHVLHYNRELHAMDGVFGVMLVIILIGLVSDKVLFAPAEQFIRLRWGTAK
jgi:NitT/TauT family transport system permease protein